MVSGKRILIVDDNIGFREQLKILLDENNLTETNNGVEALKNKKLKNLILLSLIL